MAEVKKDCFAYCGKYGRPYCRALNALYCAGGDCSFYKSGTYCDHCKVKDDELDYCQHCALKG